ncbi:unnamed protein product [Penicillium nalgiovense]|uniref:Uncharacterized protein n=1 Tax=Penicillium nalgiovense TaxID=60175 RepID=A0A1V6YM65_PENNA|nr:hypothetical protein PENNAL_c0016G10304 [Penicillium nalgiovense]CAG7945253.1 unnamed protein product [Penicillium nalgiovense]CAG7966216.1 unnamed protein product [Penicillium nalgiovense]CAG7992598.1 unnamed protein product [Penicillium nalgiovense]CAG8001075.1 unnamed protein product [Penicillium nalgiovense]
MRSSQQYNMEVALPLGGDKPMPAPKQYTSPASVFLKEEVYRLGSLPGLRSLPPGPERDFLTLSWGPIVYRTSYAPETKRLLPVFMRYLNSSVARAFRRTLIGSDEEIEILTNTYSTKIFNSREMYADMNVEEIRQIFHEFKVSLGLPETELPSRLRICLMLDDGALSHLKGVLDLSSMAESDANVGGFWVKVVEENFPDSRIGDHPIAEPDMECVSDCLREQRGSYHGWTTVALDALVEVFDGLRQMKCLVDYHREGKVYLGEGKWSI